MARSFTRTSQLSVRPSLVGKALRPATAQELTGWWWLPVWASNITGMGHGLQGQERRSSVEAAHWCNENTQQEILLKQKVLTESQKSPSGQIQESFVSIWTGRIKGVCLAVVLRKIQRQRWTPGPGLQLNIGSKMSNDSLPSTLPINPCYGSTFKG